MNDATYLHMYANPSRDQDGKPILRQLKDMTQDEFLILATLTTRLSIRDISDGVIEAFYSTELGRWLGNFSVNGQFYRMIVDQNYDIRLYSYLVREDGEETADILHHNHNNVLAIAYLIEQGFDVFGYIRDGIAVSDELTMMTT